MAARRVNKPPHGDVKAWIAAGYSESTAKSEAYRKDKKVKPEVWQRPHE